MNFKTLSLLLVTDQALFGDALVSQLQQGAGFIVRRKTEADMAVTDADQLMGLDLVLAHLPEGIRPGFADLLRSKSYRGPVLYFVQSDEVTATETIRLPVRYPALVQKIRSLAVSFWFRDDIVIEIGPMHLRPAFKELLRDGEAPIALTEREVEILIYLYRAQGKIVPREVLLAEIWGYNAEVSTHTLETHVYRLRQKFETAPDFAGLLQTEAGGYRLVSASGE